MTSRAGAAVGSSGVVVAAVVGAAALAVVFAIVPLVVLCAFAFGLPGAPSMDAVASAFAANNLVALRESLVVSVGTVVVAVVVGVPVAVLVERTDVPGGRVLGALCALPLAIPPYILAFAFRALYDDRVGLLALPRSLDVDSCGGIAVVLGTAFLPLVVLRLRASLRAMDGSLEEAARTAGATPLRALLDHTLRLALPSVLSSMALAFVAAAASWGVPVLLGLSAEPAVVVVTARIGVALQTGTPAAMREAMGLSLALAAIAGVAFLLPALYRRGRSVVVVSGKGQRPSVLPLGRARVVVGALCWLVAGALIVAPLSALVLQGLMERAGGGLVPDNLGLVHLRGVLSRDDVQASALTSAWLASASAIVVVVIATLVGVAARKSGPRAAAALRVVKLAGEVVYALPGTVVAVALVLAFGQEIRLVLFERVTFALVLGGTAGLLFVAYAVKHAALGVRAVDEALDQLHPSLEEAARIAGATPGRAFVDVALPLLRAHLVAAAVAIALPAFSELTMSVLLQAPGSSTLGVVLFNLYDYGNPQQAMALSALVVVVVLLGQLVAARARRQGRRPLIAPPGASSPSSISSAPRGPCSARRGEGT